MSDFVNINETRESVKVADLVGHLLIIEPVEYKSAIPTSFGEAEAIEVNLVDLDANTEHQSVLFFNVALRNGLRNHIGSKVLARIGLGTAKPGRSAPFILISATDNAEDVKKATTYLAGQAKATPAKPAAETPLEITPEIRALMEKLGAK